MVCDEALGRVVTTLVNDDTELSTQCSDNRPWLTDNVFALTYSVESSAVAALGA